MGDKEEVKSHDIHPSRMQNMWESEREALAFLRRNTIFTIVDRMQFCCAVIRHYAPDCGTLALASCHFSIAVPWPRVRRKLLFKIIFKKKRINA